MAVKTKHTWKSEFHFVNFGELLSVVCPYYIQTVLTAGLPFSIYLRFIFGNNVSCYLHYICYVQLTCSKYVSWVLIFGADEAVLPYFLNVFVLFAD